MDINELLEFITMLKEPSNEQITAAKELLDLTKQHLESSKQNYDGQRYNLAAYELQ